MIHSVLQGQTNDNIVVALAFDEDGIIITPGNSTLKATVNQYDIQALVCGTHNNATVPLLVNNDGEVQI